jgi:cyclopropane-fatty-acyl-phospholipid synthase
MNDVSLHARSESLTRASSGKVDFYKRLTLRALAALKLGSLQLEDQDGLQNFGDETSPLKAHVQINDAAAYRHIIQGGTVGAAEAYILGLWDSPDLVAVIRVLSANMNAMQSLERFNLPRKLLASALELWQRRNTVAGSKGNIVAHYDLGNSFFELFLDDSMMYSSAVFPHEGASLEQAQQHKLATICDKLQLTADDHLLEIGSGWGALAVYAASHYGCRVTTTTISDEQYAKTCARVLDAGLEDRVTVLNQDYRELTGKYDKLVSIEMIEAVGHEFYQTYFRSCSHLLKDDGLFLLQAITIADQRYEAAKRSVDFIKKYIFPGGCLPCNTVIAQHVQRDTDMMIIDVQDIGLDYAETLRHWRERYTAAMPMVEQQGFDERFRRLWMFYFCYCEGAFRERVISTVHALMAKPRAGVV